jgi:hypothetical protein
MESSITHRPEENTIFNANYWKTQRIELYLNKGKFQESVFTKLSRIRKIGHGSDHCYFCSKFILDRPTQEIIVPVYQKEDIVVGGKIEICGNCYDDIAENSSPLEILSNSSFIDVCVQCDNTYFVDKEEKGIRKMTNTMGKHLCPNCVYTEIEAKYEESLSVGAPLRYRNHKCHYCKQEFSTDISLPEDLHKHTNPENEALTCEECIYDGKFPIYVAEIAGLTWKLYHYDVEDYKFLSVVFKNGKELQNSAYYTLQKAALDSVNFCTELSERHFPKLNF